jgi:glycosyltransferase involved in cell wall biosynthesis/protein-tyrosine-phosphatase
MTPTHGTRHIASALLSSVLLRGTRYARRTFEEAIERSRMRRVRRDTSPLVVRLRRAKRILIVCHGNIIRSAFAARIVAEAVADGPVVIRSAGLEAVPGGPAHPIAIATAGERGVDLTQHAASRIEQHGVEEADVILVMDVGQLVTMRHRFPHARAKTFLLTCLAPHGPLDIRDPVFGDAPQFQTCFDDISRAVRPIVRVLTGTAEEETEQDVRARGPYRIPSVRGSQLKIALVTPFPLSDLGGVTTFVIELQQGLKRDGHKALLLVPRGGKRIVPVAGDVGSDIYGIYVRSLYVPDAVLKGFVAFWVHLPLSLYSLWTFLRREQIQIVHVHFPTPSCLYFCVLRLFSPWKLILSLHGSDIYALPNRSWLYRQLLGHVFSRADCIVAATAHLIDSLKTRYRRIPSRIRLIPNGNMLIEGKPGGFSAATNLPENYVLAVGSLIPRKGYDVLLRALALARDQGCDLKLVILGQGSKEWVASLATALQIEDRVTIVGLVPHRDLLPYYSSARFFVHAAREEAQGLVLVEAMSCRKAVIATRVLGIPELVRHGDTGLLVDAGDAVALAGALVTLETDDVLRETLAERAYAYVMQEHTWDRFMARHIETYETVAFPATAGLLPAHAGDRPMLTKTQNEA